MLSSLPRLGSNEFSSFEIFTRNYCTHCICPMRATCPAPSMLLELTTVMMMMLITIQFLSLFTCLLSSPKAKYKHAQGKRETQEAHTHKRQHKATSIISSSSYMVLQPISGLGLLFMRFRNLTLIDNW
jgi:hypothetical protein